MSTGKRQFRIVVASHGHLASSMVDSATMICGPLEDVAAVGLQPDQSPEGFGAALRAAMGDDARPVLILTDLFGGTPHNVAHLACRGAQRSDRRAVCIAGANLGLLLEAATSLGSLENGAVATLVSAGRDGILTTTENGSERAGQ